MPNDDTKKILSDALMKGESLVHQMVPGMSISGMAPGVPGANPGEQYWGSAKVGQKYQYTGPHPSREEAKKAALDTYPKAKEVGTGRGYHGSFDMRWHRRGED